jgi:hypothetical protein
VPLGDVNTTYTGFQKGTPDPKWFVVNGLDTCPESPNCVSNRDARLITGDVVMSVVPQDGATDDDPPETATSPSMGLRAAHRRRTQRRRGKQHACCVCCSSISDDPAMTYWYQYQ